MNVEVNSITVGSAGTAGSAGVPKVTALPGWCPPGENGWTRSHDAIRADLKDTATVFEVLLAAAGAGECQEWMGSNLVTWYQFVSDFIVAHHDHEERIFFPLIETKVKLAERFTSDHKSMLACLAELTEGVRKVGVLLAGSDAEGLSKVGDSCQQAATVSPTSDCLVGDLEFCAATLDKLDKMMRPHLLEEEEEVLPVMTANFTPKEVAPADKKMVSEFGWWELPHFYRCQTVSERNRHATKVLGIPKPVVRFILAKDFSRYDREVAWVLAELLEPKKKEENDKLRAAAGGCNCTVS